MLCRGGENEEVRGKMLNGAIKDESKREDRLDAERELSVHGPLKSGMSSGVHDLSAGLNFDYMTWLIHD